MSEKNTKMIAAVVVGAVALPQATGAQEPSPASENSLGTGHKIQPADLKRFPPNFPHRSYDSTPDILIQHTAKERAFYIPASQLERFHVGRDSWDKIGAETVVFTVPDTQFIEPVPPFLRLPSDTPHVLIQHARANAAYLLSYADLQEFDITGKNAALHPSRVSFSVPFGTELIERLPAAVNAMLQSGESAMCATCHPSALAPSSTEVSGK